MRRRSQRSKEDGAGAFLRRIFSGSRAVLYPDTLSGKPGADSCRESGSDPSCQTANWCRIGNYNADANVK